MMLSHAMPKVIAITHKVVEVPYTALIVPVSRPALLGRRLPSLPEVFK